MNKLRTLLAVAALGCLTASAQPQGYRQHKETQKISLRESRSQVFKPGKADYYTWDQFDNSWNIAGLLEYSYNDKGLLMQEVRKNPSSGKVEQKTTYKSNGNWAGFESYDWNGDLMFASRTQTKVISSTQEEEISEFYSGGEWELSDKTIYSYDNQRRIVEEVAQSFENGQWMNNYRSIYTYSGTSSAISSYEYAEWRNSRWVNFNRYSNIVWIKEDEVAKSYDIEKWEDNQWKLVGRLVTEGDMMNAVSKEQYLVRGEWVDSFRSTIVFDAKGNETLYEFEENNNGRWVIDFGSENLYVYEGDKIMELVERYWDEDINDFINSTRYVYSDHQQFASVKAGAVLNLSVYPNPSTENITFTVPQGIANAQVKLYDINGRVALAETIGSSAGVMTLNVSSLGNGIYQLMIEGQEGGYQARVVISK